MANKFYDIAIIGGGASGLMLAANINLAGRSGIILEGSGKLGTKLLMSGGGRCNITHAGSVKEFLIAYGNAGPILRKCLYKHNNLELIEWLHQQGIDTTEENGRIFPSSMKAKDLLNALVSKATANLWQIETNARVSALKKEEGLWNIGIDGPGSVIASNLVIASGGITYPETGSDGSVFSVLRDMGISVNEPRPALAPIYVNDYPYSELSGISVSDVIVSIRKNQKKVKSMSGDILFTHEGFSGPAILNISKYAEAGSTLGLEYKKELSELPRRMQRVIEERAKGPSGDIRTKVLDALLSCDDFIISGVDPKGMVTAGGIALDEIDFSSMKVKKFRNESAHAQGTGALYVIGEAIDADGITGGYNLQLCWSTACTAADSLQFC